MGRLGLFLKFITEQYEYLSLIHQDLVELDRFQELRPVIDRIYRSVHTIKASSDFMGYGELVIIAEKIEEHLDAEIMMIGKESKDFGEKLEILLEEYKLLLKSIERDDIERNRDVGPNSLIDEFKKYAKELSSKLNKKVSLNVVGDQELWNNDLIEKLKVPMLQVIRNSCVHGIEKPSERRKKGKVEEGRLEFKITKMGYQLRIDFHDDGKGVDLDEVKRAITKSNIISEEELLKLNSKQVLRFILCSGLSTTKSDMGLSGSGVGLDIVNQSIEDMGGKIELSSQKDQGFLISIIFRTEK